MVTKRNAKSGAAGTPHQSRVACRHSIIFWHPTRGLTRSARTFTWAGNGWGGGSTGRGNEWRIGRYNARTWAQQSQTTGPHTRRRLPPTLAHHVTHWPTCGHCGTKFEHFLSGKSIAMAVQPRRPPKHRDENCSSLFHSQPPRPRAHPRAPSRRLHDQVRSLLLWSQRRHRYRGAHRRCATVALLTCSRAAHRVRTWSHSSPADSPSRTLPSRPANNPSLNCAAYAAA